MLSFWLPGETRSTSEWIHTASPGKSHWWHFQCLDVHISPLYWLNLWSCFYHCLVDHSVGFTFGCNKLFISNDSLQSQFVFHCSHGLNVFNSFFFSSRLKELLKFTVRANLQHSDFEVRIALTIKCFAIEQCRHVVAIWLDYEHSHIFLRGSFKRVIHACARENCFSRGRHDARRDAKNKGPQTKRERRVSVLEAIIAAVAWLARFSIPVKNKAMVLDYSLQYGTSHWKEQFQE